MSDQETATANQRLPISQVIERRGALAMDRWRDVVDKAIAANVAACPLELADKVVEGEEERGLFVASDEIRKGRAALHLVKLIQNMNKLGGALTIEGILRDVEKVLHDD